MGMEGKLWDRGVVLTLPGSGAKVLFFIFARFK
jgi:hypothetical protein